MSSLGIYSEYRALLGVRHRHSLAFGWSVNHLPWSRIYRFSLWSSHFIFLNSISGLEREKRSWLSAAWIWYIRRLLRPLPIRILCMLIQIHPSALSHQCHRFVYFNIKFHSICFPPLIFKSTFYFCSLSWMSLNYSSEHLFLSHFGTCICSNIETNLSWIYLVSGFLSFEHPSVLLYCIFTRQLIYVIGKIKVFKLAYEFSSLVCALPSTEFLVSLFNTSRRKPQDMPHPCFTPLSILTLSDSDLFSFSCSFWIAVINFEDNQQCCIIIQSFFLGILSQVFSKSITFMYNGACHSTHYSTCTNV